MSTIVVGVDGSAASQAALSWALAEARLRGATVRAVHAWLPPALLATGVPPAVFVEVNEALRAEGEQVVEEALGKAIGDSDPGVAIEREVVEGSPADVVLRAAADADLLVVGSRGRGGFAGLLLGSVSQQCAHHAPCPIVIVRAEGS